MRIASLAEVKAKLSAYLLEAETTGPVVITRNGKAVAVLLAPIDDDDLERLLLSRSPQFRSILSESRAGISAGKGIAHAPFWREAATRSPEASEVRERPSRAPTAQRRPPAAGATRRR
jgi:prevent-host-death family protein